MPVLIIYNGCPPRTASYYQYLPSRGKLDCNELQALQFLALRSGEIRRTRTYGEQQVELIRTFRKPKEYTRKVNGTCQSADRNANGRYTKINSKLQLVRRLPNFLDVNEE
jgi:hypothetical protein